LKVGFACFACQVAPLEAVAFHDHGTLWISPNSDDRGIGFIRRLPRDRAANDVAKFETVHCLQQICGR